MALIEKINEDFLVAYKAKEMSRKDFLGVLKTEVTKESKTPENSYIVGKIKSMIKNAEATNSLSELELEILNGYLPQQLSEDTITSTIKDFIERNGIKSPKEMGKIMSFLKTEFDGQYDGKMASIIIRQLLS